MFSSSAQTQRAMAKLTLTDGKNLIVSVKLPMSGKLTDAAPTRRLALLRGRLDHFHEALAGAEG